LSRFALIVAAVKELRCSSFTARPTLQPDFTNLNGGLGVGVVGDVGKDRLRVRSEGGLKSVMERLEPRIPITGAHRRHIEHVADVRTTAPVQRRPLSVPLSKA